MKNEMKSTMRSDKCGRAVLKSRQERLGRHKWDDVDVKVTRLDYLDETPVPVAYPRLVHPPSRILTIRTANVHAILQRQCDFGLCCHCNWRELDKMVLEVLKRAVKAAFGMHRSQRTTTELVRSTTRGVGAAGVNSC